MASELSKFIGNYRQHCYISVTALVSACLSSTKINNLCKLPAEDELKSQGIHDDEEQRLLSNLRVKV